MTTLAKIGWGATVSMGDTALALTLLAEVTGIAVPDEQVDMVEATHFQSTNRHREYIAGLIESGEGEFELNYVPGSATDVLIAAAKNSGVAKFYKISLPTTAGTWEITGQFLVVGYSRSVPIDDRMSCTMRVKFTGDHAEAAGA